jgi:hypothetical protein
MDQYRIEVTLATMYNIIERGGRWDPDLVLSFHSCICQFAVYVKIPKLFIVDSVYAVF